MLYYGQGRNVNETARGAKGQTSMISFTRGDQRFNYRIAGVAICDGKVLLQKPAEEGFWFLPGGRAEFQETAEETLRREMREELHTDITVERLLWVVENFFQHGGRTFHELGLYFLMSFPKDSSILDTGQTFIVQEIIHEVAYEFIFQWHPLDSLEAISLQPSFLQTALQKLPDVTEHIVHKH
jgi:ADP-ribose pyrophosphatase YjhB (NUDIX family)